MTTSTNTASTINTNNTNTTDGVVLCCAGDLCPQLTGPTIIGSNGHPCIVCKGIMHGGPCSDGMVEDPNGMTCKKCAAAKEKSTGGEEGSNDDEVLAVDKPESVLDGATLMDVMVSQSEVNCVFKTKNKLLIRTKLVSIKGKAIAALHTPDLKYFASRVNILGGRKLKKEDLCKKILDAKDLYDKSGRDDGMLEPEKKIGKQSHIPSVSINLFRLMNVVDDSVDTFDDRAAALTKDDLTEGIKSGQKFHTALIEKYNTVGSYNENIFGNHVSNIKDPSKFEVLQKADWKAVKYQLNTSIRSYETLYKMHFKSGTHKGIDFDEFTDSKILHYIHILMQAHDGLFQKATASLPEKCFRESCNAKGSSSTPTPKKELSASAVKGNAEKERFNNTNEIRVRNLQFGILMSTKIQSVKSLNEQKAARKEAFKHIIDRDASRSKKKAKKLYMDFCKKDNERVTEVSYESDDSEMRDVYDLDQQIEDTKNNLCFTVESLQAVTKKMEGDNETGLDSESD